MVGRSRKRKLELDCSYVTEELTVDGKQYTFRQVGWLSGHKIAEAKRLPAA